MSDLDYQKLASDFVKSIRGSTAQTILNKKLQFSPNQIYRWESGNSDIYWQDFIKICVYKKIDVAHILKTELGYIQSIENNSEFIKHLQGQSQMKDFCNLVGLTVSVVSKWINQKTDPKLFHILKIIDKSGCFLPEFMSQFAGASANLTVQTLLQKSKIRRQLFYKQPVIGFIIAAVVINEYRTGKIDLKDLVQRQFNLTGLEIKNLIEDLIHVEILKTDIDGKIMLHDTTIDTRGNLTGSINLKKFWMNHALTVLNNIKSIPTPHIYPSFVVALSEDGDKKLLEATYQYASALKEICQNDHDQKTVVRLINVQYVSLLEKI